MKILVTGGSAFIGASIAESLNDKNQVSAPTSKELDVTESAAVRH